MNQMPVRFFAEQIREGCQIVLTGLQFSPLQDHYNYCTVAVKPKKFIAMC